MKQGRLDEILILLDIQAMEKEPVGAAFEDRLAMLKKAFGRDPEVSIGLSNRGRFLEKIKPLSKYYPEPISFFFIVGFDTIVRVLDKKYYPNRRKSLVELFDRSHFLVANRENDEKKEFEKFFNRKGNREYGKKVSFFNLSRKVSFISSSLVRKRIAEGKPVKGLVPEALLRWIQEKGHYKKTAITKG
jgi:nicotinic acid mononucleotide adenylyltransferase